MRPARSLPLGLLLTGCLLPDVDIQIVDEKVTNKHAIRFVEATPLTEEATLACIQALSTRAMPNPTAVCQPSDPDTVLPHFLDPTAVDPADAEKMTKPYNFCTCSRDKKDRFPLLTTTLYAEDRRNDPKEDVSMYAALQLDLNPADTEPQLSVAYTAYLDPSVPLGAPPNTLEYKPPKRQNTNRELREIRLGLPDDPIDLCNGNGQPLTPGFHTLRVIVTDAEWFVEVVKGDEDDDSDDREVSRWGVPDLANGATYDTLTYIFHCDSEPTADKHCEMQCVPREGT